MIESEYNSEELLPDDDDLFLLNLDSVGAPSPSPSSDQDPQLEGGSNPDSFPTVLHDIVSDESTDDCICWLPCGTRFQIADRKKFSKNVLSIYFGSRGTTKFTSFTRRLKRWKFNRVTKGPEMGAYYHENFVRGKPELLSKIIYPGPRKAGPTAPAPSKSSPKVKSANKARRRASTGCILQPLTDPFDVAVGSITEPTDPREKWTIESDTLDISPMPVRNKLNSSKSPMFPKDFTAWLSETNFFDDDSGLTQNESTSPKAQASVVSLSSQLSPPPLSNSNESFNAGAETHQPFRLASRRHSCIASIHSSSSPSYDVPLNDVSDAAKRNEGFDYTRPATTASSHIPVTTNNDTLWMTKQPQIQRPQQQPQQQILLQQWQQQQQQQQQQHHQQQRYEPFYQHQPQQQLLRQQQQQLLRFVSEPKDSEPLQQPILTQSTTTSMPKMQKTQKTQIHEQQQHQSQHRSSFQDETDALLRFSREFKLEDFLKDC